MRRIILIVILALVIGGAVWALWPATKWPRVFCAPVVRVVRDDADPLAISLSHPGTVLTATQRQMVATLRRDVRLAEATAPTSQLRAELNFYLLELSNNPTPDSVSNAFSLFDQKARTQLRACGVTPTGR
jgi:hypothetical protein